MSWVLTLLSGAIGALIGTYCGSYFIINKQERSIKNVRSIAIRALEIFRVYAQKKKAYTDSTSEFNTKLNITEKRAIIVALHKIGIPFEIPTTETFDIKNIKFKSIAIDRDEIVSMIAQIKKGNCDNLFFSDVEAYFISNLRINAIRSVGKKYVCKVLAKSKINGKDKNLIDNPEDWYKKFTPGELRTIAVFRDVLADSYYFRQDGQSDPQKIKVLLSEVEIGLWDNYLFCISEAYKNLQAQQNFADIAKYAMMTNLLSTSEASQNT